jgi:hypothetical protein
MGPARRYRRAPAVGAVRDAAEAPISSKKGRKTDHSLEKLM